MGRLALATAAAVAAIVLGASTGAESAPQRSGLYGTVFLSPSRPVCIVGTPCTAPLPNFRLAFSRRARVVARTRTNALGHYRVTLRAGVYSVKPALPQTIGRDLAPSRVRVGAGRPRRVDFAYDSGIR